MHLLLVGGGHAMLPTLKHARRFVSAGVAVTLLSDRRHLYYSGMIPEHLGGVYTTDEVRIDLERMCRQGGVRFVEAAAAHVDAAGRQVTTASGERVSYEVLALNVGARNPKPPRHAVLTKPIYHVEGLERQIQHVLRERPERWRLVVVGGGAAGVEVSLNVTARLHAADLGDALALTLLEPADRLVVQFPKPISRRCEALLRERGADVRLSTRVEDVSAGGVRLATGAFLEADAVLWATGSDAPELFTASGLPTDAAGFLRVQDTLRCSGHPRLFAGGDCVSIEGHEGLAKVGVHAVKEGPVLLENVRRMLEGLRVGVAPEQVSLQRFRPYPAAPLVLSTGEPEGLWVSGPLWARGRPVLRLKHLVDKRWMRKYHPAWQRPLWQFLGAEAASGR